MAAKRKLEFENYTHVDEEVGSANVHGIVTSLSPMKKSKKGNNYYNGLLSDGNNTMGFVGFAPNHQTIFQEFMHQRKCIEICNCQIKKSGHDSEKMELLVKGATKLSPSGKSINVSSIEFHNAQPKVITLNQVDDTESFTIITVDVKVVR